MSNPKPNKPVRLTQAQKNALMFMVAGQQIYRISGMKRVMLTVKGQPRQSVGMVVRRITMDKLEQAGLVESYLGPRKLGSRITYVFYRLTEAGRTAAQVK